VMSGQAYDGFKADVYAFGLIIWEIITCQKLFKEFSAWKPFKLAITGGHRPPIADDCPEAIKLLLKRCWDQNPKNRPSFPEIVFRLDEALVDVVIKDAEGRKFWKDYFLMPKQDLQEIVSWAEFEDGLTKQLQISHQKLSKASVVLAPNQEDNLHVMRKQVSMSYFNRMCFTFGHFFLPQRGVQIIEEIIKLSKEEWFHFSIDRAEAVERLKRRPEGTYLLRLRDPFGEALGCPFVISHNRQSTVVNRIIQHNPIDSPNEFVINIHNRNFTFSSLYKIIESEELRLNKPCPPMTLEKERYSNPSPPVSDDESEINT